MLSEKRNHFQPNISNNKLAPHPHPVTRIPNLSTRIPTSQFQAKTSENFWQVTTCDNRKFVNWVKIPVKTVQEPANAYYIEQQRTSDIHTRKLAGPGI